MTQVTPSSQVCSAASISTAGGNCKYQLLLSVTTGSCQTTEASWWLLSATLQQAAYGTRPTF